MRIRTIKPDFWSSGKQLRLSADAVILIVSLWNQADDEGRLSEDPLEIGAHCPRVSGKVEQLLNELEKPATQFLHRYRSDTGKRYIQIHDWHDHQVINHPRKSTIPKMRESDKLQPAPGMFPECSRNETGTLPWEGKGREGKGTEKEVHPPTIKYADNVKMTEAEHAKLIEAHGAERTARMIAALNNYKGANGRKYKSDYLAILNWVVSRIAEEDKKNGSQPQMPATKPGKYAHLTNRGLGRSSAAAATDTGKLGVVSESGGNTRVIQG